MATALGQRVLDGYPTVFTQAQLDAALVKGWIDQAEHDAALTPAG